MATGGEIEVAIDAIKGVYVEETLNRYIVALLHATRADGRLTLGASPRAGISLLRAARDAGARRMAIAPRRLPALTTPEGRALWEGIAEACDDGCAFELVVDPRPGGLLGPELEMMFETWRRLGHSDADAAGDQARRDRHRCPRRHARRQRDRHRAPAAALGRRGDHQARRLTRPHHSTGARQ